MMLRNLTRNRRRTLFTMGGVVLAVTLILTFWGLGDTVTSVLDTQFHQIQHQDAEVAIDPATPDAASAVAAVPGVVHIEPYGRYEITLQNNDRHYDTLLYALEPGSDFHTFDAGADPAAGGGIVLTEALRGRLGVGVGDTITVRAGSLEARQPVIGFTDEPMSSVAYASRAYLQQVLPTAPATGVLLQLSPDADRDAVRRAVTNTSGVVAYLDTQTLETTMQSSFGLFTTLTGLMLAFGAVMAFTLLFNAMSASTSERSVELGTLEAAGFRPAELARLVITEHLTITILAIPPGVLAGYLVAKALIRTFESDGYVWALHMQLGSILVTAVGILAAATIAQLGVPRALHRIDIAKIVRDRSL